MTDSSPIKPLSNFNISTHLKYVTIPLMYKLTEQKKLWWFPQWCVASRIFVVVKIYTWPTVGMEKLLQICSKFLAQIFACFMKAVPKAVG